jgi:hypothetical protein
MAEHATTALAAHVVITRAPITDRVDCDVCTVTAAWRVLRAGNWAVEAQHRHGSPGTQRWPAALGVSPAKASSSLGQSQFPFAQVLTLSSTKPPLNGCAPGAPATPNHPTQHPPGITIASVSVAARCGSTVARGWWL